MRPFLHLRHNFFFLFPYLKSCQPPPPRDVKFFLHFFVNDIEFLLNFFLRPGPLVLKNENYQSNMKIFEPNTYSIVL